MKRALLLIGSTVLITTAALISCNKREIKFSRKVCGIPPNRINEFSLDTVHKLVFNIEWKWSQTQLKVYFVDIDDEALIKKVLKKANQWAPLTNIRFGQTVTSTESNIRVAFRQGNGYQSLIGSMADSAKNNSDLSATMFLEDLDKESEDEFNRVILHEFGHALGLLHELQNKNSPIIWDSAAVYAYFDSAYKWTRQQVDENVLTPVQVGESTAFDSQSIMIYAIPAFLTKNHAAITWPRTFSTDDKEKIKLIYP